MAEDFESDTAVGFKRSISYTQPLSSPPESPTIASATNQGAATTRHGSDFDLQSPDSLQKKAKCCSDQEKKGIEDVKLDHKYDDVVMKLNDDEGKFSNSSVHSLVVDENSYGLSGIHESISEINRSSYHILSVEQTVEGCNKGLAESVSGSIGQSLVITEGKHNDENNKAHGNQIRRGEEVKLDHKYDDVVMKLNGDEGKFSNSLVHSLVVDENSYGLSGVHESIGEIKSSYPVLCVEQSDEGCKKGLAESVSCSIGQETQNLVITEGKHHYGKNKAENGNQIGRGEDVKCTIKIQVIDDTALIGSLHVSEVGKHMEMKGIQKNKNQEVFGNEKKSRRRGKGLKKCSVTNGNEKIAEPPQQEEKKKMEALSFPNIAEQNKQLIVNVEEVEEEKKEKCGYTRKEMEALRFANVEEQKKKWTEIYCGFGPSVTKEYDGLVNCNNQKHIQVNFDPRPLLRKKDAGPPILSDEYCENTANETQSMNCLDPACDSVVQGELIEGEEDDVDQSDEEEYCSIQKPAFLVTGEPDFDSGPPQDGLEYLRRVRWEAEHIPKVKVAKVETSKLNKEQTVYMPNIPDIARCLDHLLPQKQWEDEFLDDFTKLRLALSRLESSSTADNYVSTHEDCSDLILGSNGLEKSVHLTSSRVDSNPKSLIVEVDSSPKSLIDEVDSSPKSLIGEVDSSPKSLIAECGPTLSTISGMDYVARASMLRKRISSFETMNCLSRNDCVWLFALCAAVDTPLNADMCASLRCLLRKCASLRSQKTEMDDELVMLNIVATISGKYFGQLEN